MSLKLYQDLAKRLMLTGLVLAAIIGTAVHIYERDQIDQLALRLAIEHANRLNPELIEKMAVYDTSSYAKLQEFADELARKDFSAVDIYDPYGAHLATANHYSSIDIQKAIEARHHRFPLDRDFHAENFSLSNNSFVQVLLPLHTGQNELAGYFEGVYQVDAETMALITQRQIFVLACIFLAIFGTMIVIYPIILRLNQSLLVHADKLLNTNVELLEVLGSAIAARDNCTNEHNFRVTLYTAHIGEKLGLNADEMQKLIVGSFLHDVGKIGIADAVLHKQGPLNSEEQKLMKTHVQLGLHIASRSSWLWEAREIIEHHHEKYDGSGYGKGLKGEDIPLSARLFAVADVFDALLSKRPYKKPMSYRQAIDYIKSQSGIHFDPMVVEMFVPIAYSLYTKIARRKEQQLANMLAGLVQRYFSGVIEVPSSHKQDKKLFPSFSGDGNLSIFSLK